MDGPEWISTLDSTEASLRMLQDELTNNPQTRHKRNTSKRVTDLKDAVSRLDRTLSKMEAQPVKYKIGEGELNRRRGLLSSCRSLSESCEELMLNGAPRTNRRKKNFEETEETKDQSNSSLLQAQQSKINNQDQKLDGILEGVTKLKDMSHDINRELDLHSNLLNDLDSAVENTDTQIQRNTRRIDIIEEKSGGWCALCTMLLLLGLIIFLAVSNDACHIFNSKKC